MWSRERRREKERRMAEATTTTNAGYDFTGDLIEACSCFAPCPCWVADDPDGGACWSFTGYYVRSGASRGVDISDLSLISLVQIPGHVHDGNWREVLFVSDSATAEQHEALRDPLPGRRRRPPTAPAPRSPGASAAGRGRGSWSGAAAPPTSSTGPFWTPSRADSADRSRTW